MLRRTTTDAVCDTVSHRDRLAGLRDKRTPGRNRVRRVRPWGALMALLPLSRRLGPASEGQNQTNRFVARTSARTHVASERFSSPDVETSSSRAGELRRCTMTTTPVTSGSVLTSSAISIIAFADAAWSCPRTTAHGPLLTGILAPQSVGNVSVGQSVYNFSYRDRAP